MIRIPAEKLTGYTPKVRASLIRRYHRLYTEKYHWYVRPFEGKAYYCDGERPNVPYADVFDCSWTPEKWATTPYRYYYMPHIDATDAFFAQWGYPPLAEYDFGHTRKDFKVERNGKPIQYLWSGGFGEGHVWWIVDNPEIALDVVDYGWYTRAYSDGTYSADIFSSVGDKRTKSVDTTSVMRIARKLNASKYGGHYQPLIDRLVDVFKLNRTQI